MQDQIQQKEESEKFNNDDRTVEASTITPTFAPRRPRPAYTRSVAPMIVIPVSTRWYFLACVLFAGLSYTGYRIARHVIVPKTSIVTSTATSNASAPSRPPALSTQKNRPLSSNKMPVKKVLVPTSTVAHKAIVTQAQSRVAKSSGRTLATNNHAIKPPHEHKKYKKPKHGKHEKGEHKKQHKHHR